MIRVDLEWRPVCCRILVTYLAGVLQDVCDVPCWCVTGCQRVPASPVGVAGGRVPDSARGHHARGHHAGGQSTATFCRGHAWTHVRCHAWDHARGQPAANVCRGHVRCHAWRHARCHARSHAWCHARCHVQGQPAAKVCSSLQSAASARINWC